MAVYNTVMTITVIDQNDAKFSASSVDDAIRRCRDYVRPNDIFRIYVVDDKNPYPGYIAAWVEFDKVTRKDEVS